MEEPMSHYSECRDKRTANTRRIVEIANGERQSAETDLAEIRGCFDKSRCTGFDTTMPCYYPIKRIGDYRD